MNVKQFEEYYEKIRANCKVKNEASLQLRQLYRKSRYQITEQITSEDTEKAKKLYKTINTSKISE